MNSFTTSLQSTQCKNHSNVWILGEIHIQVKLEVSAHLQQFHYEFWHLILELAKLIMSTALADSHYAYLDIKVRVCFLSLCLNSTLFMEFNKWNTKGNN